MFAVEAAAAIVKLRNQPMADRKGSCDHVSAGSIKEIGDGFPGYYSERYI